MVVDWPIAIKLAFHSWPLEVWAASDDGVVVVASGGVDRVGAVGVSD